MAAVAHSVDALSHQHSSGNHTSTSGDYKSGGGRSSQHHHHQQPSHHTSYHDAAAAMPTMKLIRRMLRHMLRAAVYAFAARLLFGVIKSIMKRGFGPKLLGAIRDEAFSGNPVKWGVLIGSLGSFRGVRVLLEKLTGHPQVSALLAGAIASLGTFVMNVQTRTELSLYLFVRAIHGVVVTFAYPRFPKPIQDFKHWDVVAMSATAAQILYGVFFAPDCHSPSYQTFLVNCTMFDPRAISAVAGLQRRLIVPDAIDLCWDKKLPLPKSSDDILHSCKMLHPGMDCNQSFVNFLLNHLWKFSIPTYLPLKIVTTLLFSFKKLVKHPGDMLVKIVTQSLSSSLFLTLYCAGPFRVLCFFNQMQWHAPIAVALACGSFAGPPTLLEPKGRRLDLALFCSMHALRNAYLNIVSAGYLPRPNRHYISLMIASALAFLFYQTDFYPEVAHQNVRSSISWVLQEPHVLHHHHVTVEKADSSAAATAVTASADGAAKTAA